MSGNTAATTTERIRAMCRDSFELAAPALLKIAQGEREGTTPAVQVRAVDTLGKYGLGASKLCYLEQGDWVRPIAELTARYLSPEDFKAWREEVKALLNAAR